MKKVLSLFSVVLLASTALTGCVSQNNPRWYQQGVSAKETHRYYQECAYNVGMNKVSQEKERRLIRACMEKAGFVWLNR